MNSILIITVLNEKCRTKGRKTGEMLKSRIMEVLNSVMSVIINMYNTKYSTLRKRLSNWKSKKDSII